jgi:thioredoxin 1
VAAAPLTDVTWDVEVLGTDKCVIVGFGARWSSPSQVFSPVLDALADDLAGRAVVYALDVDDNPGAARQYDVSSLPTLLVFCAGELTGRMVGARPKERLLRDLLTLLP